MGDPAAKLELLLARADRLCSLPAVAMRVLQLTADPQVDVYALKTCIENDPALTSKLLRVVNSSLFGLSQEVSDLNQALALLGTKPLKMLVLGFSLPPGLLAGLSGEILGRYWRRTLTKAVAARELCERVWRMAGDEAFIAALMQDVGVLLLIQELGGPYVKFLDKVQCAGQDLEAFEEESLGFRHTTLSARLLAHWGLPEQLIEAVAWTPDAAGDEDAPPARRALQRAVHLGELLVRLLIDNRLGTLNDVLAAAPPEMQLTQPALVEVIERLEAMVQQLADVLSLQLPPGVDYRDVVVRSQKQLAEVAATAVGDLLAPSAGGKTAATGRIPRKKAPAGAAGKAEIDPGLLGRLEAAVAACRQARHALSLLLVEWHQYDKLLLARGVDGAERLRRLLESLCRQLDHPGLVCLSQGEAGFAVILPDCDRRRVAQLGNVLIGSLRRLAAQPGSADPTPTINVGAASVPLPPKNFPPQDLWTSAERCLYGSRSTGGSVMKSIEIF